MDPAQEFEQKILARQKPMIAAIAQGGSPVQQFYKGTTIFLTGGTGFVGKQLVEKLFRSCEIKKIYMLLRPKKGKTVQQRLASILQDALYDTLREMQPEFVNKIDAVEGDIENIRLGLSEKNWTMITEEVNVIFHVAATVRFNEPIKKATLINVRGTREALMLAKQCKNLKCFNHTSTAFAHATKSRINTDVEEKFYPCPVPPNLMIEIAETVAEGRLDAITPNLIDGWPNTYTFTKALAEELIRSSARDMPVCILKPPVVACAYLEPSPGWIDIKACLSSPTGAVLAGGLGIMHVLIAKRDVVVSYAPVDYVNNALIVASWDSVERKKRGDKEVPVYTVSTSALGTKWGLFGDVLNSEGTKFASPKSVWYAYGIETSSTLVYWLLTWILHYIPGYFADGILDLFQLRPKGIPKLVDVYSRIYSMSIGYLYFLTNFWNFKDDNLKGMIERMSDQDRTIFNCDVRTIDFKEQVLVFVIGIRRFIIKDGLKGTVAAVKKQKYLFKYLNILFFAAYGYLIYTVLSWLYVVITTILRYLS